MFRSFFDLVASLIEDVCFSSIPEGGVTKKSVAQNFSRDPGAIKSVEIESRDIELFKKSNETF